MFSRRLSILSIAALIPASAPLAQSGGVIHTIEVSAPSLRGNLLGDSARRLVSVYLPPEHTTEPGRRFPVIYLLHGFAADHKAFIAGAYQDLNVRVSMDSLIAAGKVQPMIVVTPNARNRFDGSFYANSPTTGDWEDFVKKDLVRDIDRRYRTIARVSSRGLAGHSMGGYGTLTIGMRNPEVFSAIYALSACCLGQSRSDMSDPRRADIWKKVLGVTDTSQIKAAGFQANLFMALAAVYSPAPDRPPLFVAYPFTSRNDSLVPDPAVSAKWIPPIMQIEQYARNLARLTIGFDAGRSDGLTDIPVNARVLDQKLSALGIPHVFEIYEGTHGSHIRERLEKVVFPFFSNALEADKRRAR